MKRFWIFIIITILTATQCSHPYEEGMSGAFPYLEMLSGTSANFQAESKQKGSFEVSTNMYITTKVEYISNSSGWITDITTSDKGNSIKVVSYNVSPNTKRSARTAKIKILADGSQTAFAITINQAAYEMTGTEAVYEGDLILRSQEEVSDCIYTAVTGNLTISGDDITNLNSLEYLRSIGGNLIINNCASLHDLGPLKDLDVNTLEINYAWASSLLESYNGSFSSLVITGNLNPDFSIGVLKRFSGLKELTLANVNITDLEYFAELEGVESVTITNCPINRQQMNYVVMTCPDIDFTTSGLNNSTFVSFQINACEEYSASFYAYLEYGGNAPEMGYILSDDGTFDFSKKVAVETYCNSYASTYFDVTGLEHGHDYLIWAYFLDENNDVFLSEAITFTTNRVNFYNYTVSPVYPSFGNSSETASFDSFYGYMVLDAQDDPNPSELIFSSNEDGTYGAQVPEGYLPIYMFASEGDGTGYTLSFATDYVALKIDEDTGADNDISVASTYNTYNYDYSESIGLIRPVSKIGVNVDFSGSVGSLDDIRKIDVKLIGFYQCWTLYNDGSTYYSGERSYSFSTETDGQSEFINVVSDKYVLPHIVDEQKFAIVTISFENGETVSSTAVLSDSIEGNNIYDITIKVKLNRFDGTFTVDEVENIDGGIIEF